MRFQTFDHPSSPYERPTRAWRCGRAEEGKACLAGPDARGRCQGTVECMPKRHGDRWLCTRSAAEGGRCEPGPLPDGSCGCSSPPCVPVRAMWSLGRMTAVWVVSVTIGLVIWGLSGERWGALVEPGRLAFAHGEIEACSACHGAADQSPLEWSMAVLAEPAGHAESEKCLKCHSQGSTPLRPHALSKERLSALTDKDRKPIAVSALFRAPKELQDATPCAVCHREHEGKRHALTDMADRRCQACHTTQFRSLEDGHPDFGTYPFSRRTPIIFNHWGHFDNHYKDFDNPPRTCAACHVIEPVTGAMTVKSFTEVCTDCHIGQIDGSERPKRKHLPFISVPALDLESLRLAGAAIGEWPTSAEGEVTPIMRVLIRELDSQVFSLYLEELRGSSAEEFKAVEGLAWQIKRLIHDLMAKGSAGFEARLRAALGKDIDEQSVARAAAAFPRDALVQFQRRWFPNLAEEIDALDMGQPPPTKAVAKTASDTDDDGVNLARWSRHGGWYREESSLVYRINRHEDDFMRAWFEIGIQLSDGDEWHPLLEDFTGKRGAGQCAKCHSIDAHADGRLRVNWTARIAATDPIRFTRFDHKPHFSTIGDEGCLTCHPRDKSDKTLETYEELDISIFDSNFKPTARQVCLNCHVAGETDDRCVLCHRYHVGRSGPSGGTLGSVATKTPFPGK